MIAATKLGDQVATVANTLIGNPTAERLGDFAEAMAAADVEVGKVIAVLHRYVALSGHADERDADELAAALVEALI